MERISNNPNPEPPSISGVENNGSVIPNNMMEQPYYYYYPSQPFAAATTTNYSDEMIRYQYLWYQHQQLLMQQQQLMLLQEQFRQAQMNNNNNNSLSSLSSSPTCSPTGRLNNNKRRRGGRVGFSADMMVYSNPRDFDEVSTSWYTKDELAVFKGERKTIIRELKKVNFDLSRIDQSVHYLRGLEPYLSIRFNKLIQEKRTEVLHSVLAEQAHQRSQGRHDCDALRSACCQASEWARKRGLALAEQDSMDVGTCNRSHTTSSSSSEMICPTPSTEKTPHDSWQSAESDTSHQTPSLCDVNSEGSASSSDGEQFLVEGNEQQQITSTVESSLFYRTFGA